MKALLTLGITVALLVAAWLVSLVTPDEVAWRDGYPIVGAMGEEISDRNVRVTITSVTIADEVTEDSDSYPRSPGAVWVVVGVSAQALTDETEGSINHATLTVDGAVYRPSDRGATAWKIRRCSLRRQRRGTSLLKFRNHGQARRLSCGWVRAGT